MASPVHVCGDSGERDYRNLVVCMQAGELERVEKEINLCLQGIGLSLINDKQCREIAYMAISRLASVVLY